MRWWEAITAEREEHCDECGADRTGRWLLSDGSQLDLCDEHAPTDLSAILVGCWMPPGGLGGCDPLLYPLPIDGPFVGEGFECDWEGCDQVVETVWTCCFAGSGECWSAVGTCREHTTASLNNSSLKFGIRPQRMRSGVVRWNGERWVPETMASMAISSSSDSDKWTRSR